MGVIPVLWVHHDLDGMCRGYWDCGLIEALFARELWVPRRALAYEHHELRGDFAAGFSDGAVVVLPTRHHRGREKWFVDQLDRMDWSLVILAGTEEWSETPAHDPEPSFDWTAVVETPTRRVWVMQPIPAHERLSGQIPGGWYPGTPQGVSEGRTEASQPILDWFFAGQITHERREQCAAVLRDLDGGELIETEGYTQGIPQDDYFRRLASAKVVPCPSGPEHVDTARTFEALEAGIVPVCDLVKPHTRHSGQFDYWTMLFGADCPIPAVYSWDEFPETLTMILDDWPAAANQCSAMWQQWKRRTARQLDDDVRAVRHNAGVADEEPTTVTDEITVLMTTSLTPLHPSTEHVEQTIASIRGHLPLAEIVIVCDGLHEDDEDRRLAYEEYQRRLFWLCNFRWHNVVPLRREEWGHQVNAAREALAEVKTDFVLFVEHDQPLKEYPIAWGPVVETLRSGRANVVRFHHEAEILPDHVDLFMSDQGWDDESLGCSYLPTKAWWQRPHVARRDFYERLMARFGYDARCFIEDQVYGWLLNDLDERGEGAWWDWRVVVYEPNDEGTMQRSYHIDSRGDTPKHEQTFSEVES
jgi:hypothetical protein